jgi:DNA-binding SARP family transcriptional activator
MASVDRIDVELLERAFLGLKDVDGEEINDAQVAEASGAVEGYRGELLEGWYQDWCIFERERLKAVYLSLLEKLLASCERRRRYESALAYGEMILRHERAHERTHARMMRLHFFAGNRTGAIRQFQACAASLEEELGVRPGARTVALYERIRDDGQIEPPEQAVLPGIAGEPNRVSEARTTTEVVERLDDIGRSLSRVERLVERDIRAVHASARRDRRDRARPT